MSLRFTKNFSKILSQAYGGADAVIPYNVLRGPQAWLATQSIDSRVTTDNTDPSESGDFYFVRTINGNYLPLARQNSNSNAQGWDCAATLAPSAILPFEMKTNGETYIPASEGNQTGPYYGYEKAVYGVMFGSGGLSISDAFEAYNVEAPVTCQNMLAQGADYRPINAIQYDSETDKYSQQLKWNLYNLGSTDFTFSEVGIFCSLNYFSDRTNLTGLYKSDVDNTWYTTRAYGQDAPQYALPVMIAYEAFDNAITLHSGDILQIVLTQGAAGLDWTIRPNTGDAGVEGTVAPPPEKQTTTPTQQEIQTETSDISDATAKAVVELAETYIGNAVYTQALSGTPNRNGAGKGYDCSSFCFYMWQRNGVTCSDSWQSGQNAPNTEALGKWAISNNKLVSKSQIQVGDIILTARKNSDGTWKYPDKWNYVNHAKLYVGDRVRPDGYHYNVIEMVGTDHDAIRSYYNLDDAQFVCAFIIHP